MLVPVNMGRGIMKGNNVAKHSWKFNRAKVEDDKSKVEISKRVTEHELLDEYYEEQQFDEEDDTYE